MAKIEIRLILILSILSQFYCFYPQWGHAISEKVSSFNIAFTQNPFIVVASNGTDEDAHAISIIDNKLISPSSFKIDAVDFDFRTNTTKHYKDLIYWFSIGI